MDEIYVTYVDDEHGKNFGYDDNTDDDISLLMIYDTIIVFDRVRSSQIKSKQVRIYKH